MPIHSSENGGMYCGSRDGPREYVKPSDICVSRRLPMAFFTRRGSPESVNVVSASSRPSPMYCNCS